MGISFSVNGGGNKVELSVHSVLYSALEMIFLMLLTAFSNTVPRFTFLTIQAKISTITTKLKKLLVTIKFQI